MVGEVSPCSSLDQKAKELKSSGSSDSSGLTSFQKSFSGGIYCCAIFFIVFGQNFWGAKVSEGGQPACPTVEESQVVSYLRLKNSNTPHDNDTVTLFVPQKLHNY